MDSDDVSVFVDISVLIDYCTPYTPQHKFAKQVLDKLRNEGGDIVISNRAGKTLTERIANQQELFEHLFNEASKCMKEYSQPSSVYKGEVLNREELDSKLPVGINTQYNMRALRSKLDEIGLEEFRELVHNFQRINHRQQRRLETSIICDRYEVGGEDTTYVKMSIGNKSNDKAQIESIVDGIYWCRRKNNKILVRHTDPLYQEREDLQNSLPTTHEYNVVSPQDTVQT